MMRRMVAVWFPHLLTERMAIRQPSLKQVPYAFSARTGNRIVLSAVSEKAEKAGLFCGMPVADARALISGIRLFEEQPGKKERILSALAAWCIRFSPFVVVDEGDGLLFDATGCSHLWGGEISYLQHIFSRFRARGYSVRIALADTAGAARAISRYAENLTVVPGGEQAAALSPLPPPALRIEAGVQNKLEKLGLNTIGSFMHMPRSVLRRRFGEHFLLRLGQALGHEDEILQPVSPPKIYQERLACLEPVSTAEGIGIAIQTLLEKLCAELQRNGKGLRKAELSCHRIDDKVIRAETGTHRASHEARHIFRLFELKLPNLEPGPGIELFVMDIPEVEDIHPDQQDLWPEKAGLDHPLLAGLLDRIENKIGRGKIHRYLPAEHHWPERSVRLAQSLDEKPAIAWRTDRPRPILLLPEPEPVEVTVRMPDYPPMFFRHKGVGHKIVRADGPERIEQEWWLHTGEHRDYYVVEDEAGTRFWLFRLGHYAPGQTHTWFIHGYFA